MGFVSLSLLPVKWIRRTVRLHWFSKECKRVKCPSLLGILMKNMSLVIILKIAGLLSLLQPSLFLLIQLDPSTLTIPTLSKITGKLHLSLDRKC